MNEQIIKMLKAECKTLYPKGYPMQPKGCGKTYLQIIPFLRWNGYQFYCHMYEKLNYEVTLEQAHKDIENYITGQITF